MRHIASVDEAVSIGNDVEWQGRERGARGLIERRDACLKCFAATENAPGALVVRGGP